MERPQDLWSPDNSFESLKKEILKIDPISFAEQYIVLDGKPMDLTNSAWCFMSDIYRYIATTSISGTTKPVVIVKGRQVGATVMAGILSNYFVAGDFYGKNGVAPIRVMHVFPQIELMLAYSKDKLDKLINGSTPIQDWEDARNPGKIKPYIESRKDSKRESTDSLTYKQFKNGNSLWCDSIGIDGTRVRGRTTDVMFFDEVQDMTEEAINVATKCLTHAQHGGQDGVQMYFGTPKQKGSYFHRLWEHSDQRRYYLRCVDCNELFTFYTPGSEKWQEIWLHENIVKCTHCGCEQEKTEAMMNGKWVPTEGKENAPFIGFHFNQFYIPHITKEKILSEHPESGINNSEIVYHNEVLGEFHSGENLPITFEEIMNACVDRDRSMSLSVTHGSCYLGIDWGGKPDIDNVKRGQSFSCGLILNVAHDGRFIIEFAHKLKKINLHDKISFVDEMFRLYNLKSAVGDIGFANDLSSELKLKYGEKYKTARNSGYISSGIKYNEDELEIVVDKDKIISEVFELLRKGAFRFPGASYERIKWLIDHCSSMESKIVSRQGQPHQTFIKGAIQNDGLMALIYAYIAYKFDKTGGFVKKDHHSGAAIKPVLGYAPRLNKLIG